MRETLIDLFCCPECHVPLALETVVTRFELDKQAHVTDAVLRCDNGHRFPVMDEVARLVPLAQFTREESDFLRQVDPTTPARNVVPDILSAEAVETHIRLYVEKLYGSSLNTSASARVRAAEEIAYLVAEYDGRNKRKYAALLEGLASNPRTILDLGGSLPGLLRCLYDQFHPTHAVLADLNSTYSPAFKTCGREVTLIRADVQALPFRDLSFDLVVSAFLLEHVPDWRKAVRHILRVGRQAFVAFGPNRWFPYEIGHVDAPLAGTLPKAVAPYIAYVWLKLTRRGRTLRRIKETLEGMTYISSRAFRKECRSLQGSPQNVFPEFIQVVATDRSAPPTSWRRLIRRWPRTIGALSRLLVSTGFEPQMYYFLRVVSGR